MFNPVIHYSLVFCSLYSFFDSIVIYTGMYVCIICVHIYVLLKGVLTTISPKGFSVSLNERGLGGNPFEDAIAALFLHKARDPSYLLREVCT